MAKPILISGVQPTGRLHIGNFLGSLKNFVGIQNSDKYQCYFFIADLHSLTEDFKPEEKYDQILELATEYLAAGLTPKKSTIFVQSQIPAHAELMWLLTTITPEGELRRMTQYKDKVMVKKEEANSGLLMYPVLMAADILLYDAKFVPVGEDQLQHLELTRTLARKFNNRFGKTFIEPKPILTKTPRVMSLADPQKKMSKSQPEGCLFLDDRPEDIKRKISRATTDSGTEIKHDPERKPGISNLLEIYSSLTDEPISKIEKKFAGQGYASGYAGFKKSLAGLIADYFADFRKKKKELTAKSYKLKAVLDSGSEQAAAVAEKKILEVKKKVGLI